jgi:hypothetical protein
MPNFIAICLPKKLITMLLGESRSTINDFITNELPKVIDKHEHEITHICLEASSADVATKILSWKNPDLFVVHMRNENHTPPEE